MKVASSSVVVVVFVVVAIVFGGGDGVVVAISIFVVDGGDGVVVTAVIGKNACCTKFLGSINFITRVLASLDDTLGPRSKKVEWNRHR